MTNPAIEVAKEHRSDEGGEIRTLSSGVRVKLIPVNPATITEIIERVKDPEVPMYYVESHGREEPNPLDPVYLRQLANADARRGNATMDALALLGVELVDGLPEDGIWLKKLKLLERAGHLDLSTFDLEDEIDLKYLYVKHIAIGESDWEILFQKLAVTEGGIQAAGNFLQGDKVERPDRGSRNQTPG